MKKRILGLLLALCLVVGLLPVAALADEPVKGYVYSVNKAGTGLKIEPVKGGNAIYYCTVDGYVSATDANGAAASESNYNIKMVWPADSNELLVYLKGAVIDNSNNSTALKIGGTYGNNYRNENFAAKLIVEADSTINKPTHGGLYFNNTMPNTITSVNNAKLTINTLNSQPALESFSALTLDNANIAITYNYYAAVHVKGDFTVNGSTLDIQPAKSTTNANHAVTLADGYSTLGDTNFSSQTRNILIKNSVVTTGRPGTNYKGAWHNNGTVVIDNSSVEAYGNWFSFAIAPEVKNCTTAIWGEYSSSKTADYAEYSVAAGASTVDAGAKIGYFKTEHTCTPAADDKDCTTATVCAACGKEIAPAQAAHKYTDDGDCTTAVKCENAGCEVVVIEAKAAHVAGADDGDCTTAVKCTNAGCTKDAIAAKPHTADRTSCDVAVNCTVCGKLAYAAGQHSGGTATCKEKAKCEHCGKEYGELAACTPGADDGNCTTAVKCSVCGKDAIAAKTHKYTNDADTSCDNAGCTYTRKVEKDPGKAPGDSTVLVLWFSILAVSVVGFVSVMVFGKKRFVK